MCLYQGNYKKHNLPKFSDFTHITFLQLFKVYYTQSFQCVWKCLENKLQHSPGDSGNSKTHASRGMCPYHSMQVIKLTLDNLIIFHIELANMLIPYYHHEWLMFNHELTASFSTFHGETNPGD